MALGRGRLEIKAHDRHLGPGVTNRNLLFSRAGRMPERVGLIKVKSAGIGPGRVCCRLRLPAGREPKAASGSARGGEGSNGVWKAAGDAGRGRTGALSGPPNATLGAVPPLPPSPPVQSSTGPAIAGGPRARLSSHSPQCRRIFSITSVWCRSMKAMIFIAEPHLGQQSGSASYTCLISAAQHLRASRAVGERAGAAAAADAAGCR